MSPVFVLVTLHVVKSVSQSVNFGRINVTKWTILVVNAACVCLCRGTSNKHHERHTLFLIRSKYP